MSEFPPPNIGPDAGGTPPQPPTGFQPGAFPLAAPPDGRPGYGQVGGPFAGPPPTGKSAGSKRGLIIGAIILVVVLAGVGIFVATRRNDSGSTSTDTTIEVTGATVPGTVGTVAPVTTAVAQTTTTAEKSTTTVEASTTTTSVFTVPGGALDLGHQVYLPVPAGWAKTSDAGQVIVISDGAGSSASFQALARDPGEDIVALTQEYTNTFDSDFGAVGFGPMRFVRQIDATLPIDQYRLYYTTYDPGQLDGIDGTISIFVRSDGLSLVYDSYSTVSPVGLPDDSYQALVKSMLDAATLGPSVPLVQHDPFLPKSVSPFVQVQGIVGFTTTPGFNVVTAGSGHAFTSNGSEDIEVITTNTQPDTATLIATAQGYLATNYQNVTFTPPTQDPADLYGVVHGTLTWAGTYVDGTPSAGTIDYFLDPTSKNGYAMYRNWFTTAGPNEPFAAESAFMERSFYNSLTTIP